MENIKSKQKGFSPTLHVNRVDLWLQVADSIGGRHLVAQQVQVPYTKVEIEKDERVVDERTVDGWMDEIFKAGFEAWSRK